MRRVPVALWILLVSLIALGAFLFLDLKEKKDPLAWDLDLDTIRFEDMAFEKQSSFKGDRFYASFEKDGKKYRYRASTAVPNLFAEFEQFKIQGLYLFDAEIKKQFPEDPFADSEKTKCMELVPSSENAFKVCASTEERNGKVFVVANRPQNQGEAYLVQSYLFDRLKQDKVTFLEKRVFLYPTATSTEEMNITLMAPMDVEKATVLKRKYPEKLHLLRKEKEQDEKKLVYWASENGQEIPAQLSNPLDSVLRQFQIQFFSFEYDFDPAQMWEKATPILEATLVAAEDGDPVKTFHVEVRRPEQELEFQGKKLLLMQSSELDGVQVLDLETVTRTAGYVEGIYATEISQGNSNAPAQQ
ncbi:MAG: hypothetical protein KDK33_14415 [Leptospiraceae bacterium]|nr:hypothetical protein [Leptospiraceae bacterium]